MAWSDAARKAAAEARRLHAKTKPSTVGRNQAEMASLLKQGLAKKQAWAVAERSRLDAISARDAKVMTALTKKNYAQAKSILRGHNGVKPPVGPKGTPHSKDYFYNAKQSTQFEKALISHGVHPTIARQTARRKLGPGL